MNAARNSLAKGALKSAVGSATALIISLPVIDPSHFSTMTLAGWLHLFPAIVSTVVISEARFFKQWADSGDEPEPLQHSLDTAAARTSEAGDAIAKAQSEAPKGETK